jgi:hypothetical protein
VRKIRRTEVTVETHEITIIRCSQELVAPRCRECAETVEMITPEQAAALTFIHVREIFRWIEAGWVHYSETPQGSLLVCPNSILNRRPQQHIEPIKGLIRRRES